MYFKSILLFIISVTYHSEAARILAVFPTPSISHQVVFRPLTQELAKRGHEVVVITTDTAFPKGETPANLTEIDIHDISYELFQSKFLAVEKGVQSSLFRQMETGIRTITEVVGYQLQSSQVQEIINDKKQRFDLLLLEACVRPALVFSHIFKAPVIQVSSFGPIIGNYETMGAPTHPILYPSNLRQKLNDLTLWDKINEMYTHYSFVKLLNDMEESETQMLRKIVGPDVPDVNKLRNNVHMMFINYNPILEGNVPVPPGVIHMGGIHVKTQRELPADLKAYLDSSKHGVIYLSFGTNTVTSSLPADKIQEFVKVFSQLPYDVLWKWEKDELPGRTSNIRIGKWFPQSDLLRHPKVKLFITQGGLQSTDEAIEAGVPLVGIPMLADQWYNVEKYVSHKIGVRVDFETLTEDVFKNAIKNVIEEKSYRQNIVKLRTLMRDQPQPPLERAVWWTEYVLRHGGATHLRSPAANMSWRDYLELDLILILTASALAVMLLMSYIAYRFVKYLCKNFVTTSIKLKLN